MASIVFGAGTSHTPMLNAAAEEWPLFEEIDRQRSLLHKDGRRATYAELLAIAPPGLQAELAPETLATRHAGAMLALGRLHEGLIGAQLDAVVVIGDDHKEIYHDDNMPSILVYRGETIANVPNRTRTPRPDGARPDGARPPDWMKRASARYYEESETRHYPVHAKLANHLIAALIDRDFDVASANALPEGEGEGHAFGFVHRRIMKGVAIPVVPVFLNTYYPPNQPSPGRCYRLGQAIREVIEGYAESLRIGVVASGGLSHFTVDEALDSELIRALREKDARALQTLPREQLNSGSSEIRNWICAAGALEHLDLSWVDYFPGYRTSAGTGTGLCFASWA
jgi:Catalytic LigB subunit of aromatic ring-opening dioxygenase